MNRLKLRRKVVSFCMDPINEGGNVNPYETYGTAPKGRSRSKTPAASNVRSTKQNGAPPGGQSNSAPSSPTTVRRRGGQSSAVRLTNHVTYGASTLPRSETTEQLEKDAANTAVMQHSSSLLQLPILDHTQTVLNLTRAVMLEMLNVDSILTSLAQFGVIERTLELELMGLVNNSERCEKLLDHLETSESDLDDFIDVLRSNKRQYPLAEYIDVHHQLIRTITDIHDNSTGENIEGSMEDIGHDCAIMHFESSYWDSATCEAIPISETKSLAIPLKEAFDLKSKAERHRRSFYETITINDWNAHLNDKNNIIPVISIDLYNQRIGLEGAKVIASLLLKYSCIRELCLAKNDIDIHGFSRITRSLSNNHGLAKLDVRLNPIGDAGADHVSRALKVNKSLRVLNMTSTTITGTGVNFLVEALVKNTSLTDLDIGFNDLSQTNCDELSQVLKQNIYLKRLRMRQTNMNPAMYITIFDSLKTNSRLSILDISGNLLGDDGAKKLADMLVSNRTLNELNIEKCEFQIQGAFEIARALKANTTLKSLDLSMNDINDYGANAIGEALKYNRSLQSLCMNMCQIGNEGFLSLLCSLEGNKAVKTLKICFNQIGLDDRSENADDYYKLLGIIDDKYQLLSCREDLKILMWGNRLEDALRIRKNGRYTTL